MTDAPAACNIGIPSPAVVFTARHGHHYPSLADHLHIVNLVDRHLQVEHASTMDVTGWLIHYML